MHQKIPTLLNVAWKLSRRFPTSQVCGWAFRTLFNWYEGGWPVWTNGNFSYLPSLVQDARWDQNFVTRREMLRRMRYWSQNSAIVESILSLGERYTVGASGLHVSFYPDTDYSEDVDNSWYERAEQVFGEWAQACGWNGESFEQLLKIAYRCQKVDGEIFIVKTRKEMPLELTGEYGTRTLMVKKPCLQMVEAHRVESPWNRFEQEGDSLVDGVQFTRSVETGLAKFTKVGYWMRSGLTSFEQNDSWDLVSVNDVWHIFNSHRVNQFRGLSDFYPVAIDINKLEDLIELEMKAAQTQSLRAVVIKNNAGAANPLDKKLEAVRLARGLAGQPPVDPTQGQGDRREMYEKVFGARVEFIKNGEEIENLAANRPSDATLNQIEFSLNKICAGSKAPRCLVMHRISRTSGHSQGTEVRAELDNADIHYRSDFQKWGAFTKDAVIFFMEWAIRNDPRVSDPPANWKNCIHVQQPEACNVDVGYTTQADVTRLASGLTSYEILLGQQGKSAVKVFRQLAREQKMIKALGIEVTLPGLMKGNIPLDGSTKERPEEQPVPA